MDVIEKLKQHFICPEAGCGKNSKTLSLAEEPAPVRTDISGNEYGPAFDTFKVTVECENGHVCEHEIHLPKLKNS